MPRLQIAILLFMVAGALWAVAPREDYPNVPPTASIVLAVAASWAALRFRQRFERKEDARAGYRRRS